MGPFLVSSISSPVRGRSSKSPARASTLRVVLVQTYHPYTQFTHVHPLGIMAVASAARWKGDPDMHLLDMKVEGWTPEEACDAIEPLAPHLISPSAMADEARCMHAGARQRKRRPP